MRVKTVQLKYWKRVENCLQRALDFHQQGTLECSDATDGPEDFDSILEGVDDRLKEVKEEVSIHITELETG